MNCPNCNTEVATGGKFCRKCGLALPGAANQSTLNLDDVATRELGTAVVPAPSATSTVVESIPPTERITTDLLDKPVVSVKSTSASLATPKASSQRRNTIFAVGLIALITIAAFIEYRRSAASHLPSTQLAEEEVTSFLADYKSKEPHAMARHIMASRQISDEAIDQVGKLLSSGALELQDYKVVKADSIGSDVSVQVSGTVKVAGNAKPFTDNVMVHGDSGRWRIMPPTLDQVSDQGSPSYLVGSFLETILLAKLDTGTPTQAAPKPKQQNATPQSSSTPRSAPTPETKESKDSDQKKPDPPPPPGAKTIVIPTPTPGAVRETAPPDFSKNHPGGANTQFYMPSFPVQIVVVPRPMYTEEARKNKIEGNVVVEATFRSDGTVANPHVLRGLGYGLDEQAIEVVKRVRFVPARSEGKTVDVTRPVVVTFRLPA